MQPVSSTELQLPLFLNQEEKINPVIKPAIAAISKVSHASHHRKPLKKMKPVEITRMERHESHKKMKTAIRSLNFTELESLSRLDPNFVESLTATLFKLIIRSSFEDLRPVTVKLIEKKYISLELLYALSLEDALRNLSHHSDFKEFDSKVDKKRVIALLFSFKKNTDFEKILLKDNLRVSELMGITFEEYRYQIIPQVFDSYEKYKSMLEI